MSCCTDSDIFGRYGWLEPWPGQPANALVNLSAKTELVAWVVSDWRKDSTRCFKFISKWTWMGAPTSYCHRIHDLVPVPVQV